MVKRQKGEVSIPSAGLPDMTNVDLTALAQDPPSALQRAAERVVKQLDDPDGVISAFQSYAS